MSESARQAVDVAQRRAATSDGFLQIHDWLLAWSEELSWADCAIARGLADVRIFSGRSQLENDRSMSAAGMYSPRSTIAVRPTEIAQRAEALAAQAGADFILESHLVGALMEGRESQFNSLGLLMEAFVEYVRDSELTGTSREAEVYVPGRRYDALQRFIRITKLAKREAVLIDNYVDSEVLDLFTETPAGVSVKILTTKASAAFLMAAKAFAEQRGPLEVRLSEAFHDRFVIVDDAVVYHLGASIKDAGGKTFRVSQLSSTDDAAAVRRQFAAVWPLARVASR